MRIKPQCPFCEEGRMHKGWDDRLHCPKCGKDIEQELGAMIGEHVKVPEEVSHDELLGIEPYVFDGPCTD